MPGTGVVRVVRGWCGVLRRWCGGGAGVVRGSGRGLACCGPTLRIRSDGHAGRVGSFGSVRAPGRDGAPRFRSTRTAGPLACPDPSGWPDRSLVRIRPDEHARRVGSFGSDPPGARRPAPGAGDPGGVARSRGAEPERRPAQVRLAGSAAVRGPGELSGSGSATTAARGGRGGSTGAGACGGGRLAHDVEDCSNNGVVRRRGVRHAGPCDVLTPGCTAPRGWRAGRRPDATARGSTTPCPARRSCGR